MTITGNRQNYEKTTLLKLFSMKKRIKFDEKLADWTDELFSVYYECVPKL